MRLRPAFGQRRTARLIAGAAALRKIGAPTRRRQGPDTAPVEGAGDQGAGAPVGVRADPSAATPAVARLHQDQAPVEAADALLVPSRRPAPPASRRAEGSGIRLSADL